MSQPADKQFEDVEFGEDLPQVDVDVSLETVKVFAKASMMLADRFTDHDAAKKAGLRRPIAGGSHVLAVALEAVMAGVGDEVFLHGATIDARWKAPTEDGAVIVPSAEVTAVGADAVHVDLAVQLVDGPLAMVATAVIPLSR